MGVFNMNRGWDYVSHGKHTKKDRIGLNYHYFSSRNLNLFYLSWGPYRLKEFLLFDWSMYDNICMWFSIPSQNA
jgi:hypothetical protein